MRIFKLSELCASIYTCITRFYDGEYYIVAETMDVHIHNSLGHCYLDLLEKDADERGVVAKMKAVIWNSVAKKELTKFEKITGVPFRGGIKVLIKARLNYDPVYGLSLIINAIDPTYTLGEFAKKRLELIRRLQRENLIDRNKSLSMPVPTKRIAVISSETAAGWGDFQEHLQNNPYAFPFSYTLFRAYMQGDKAPQSIIDALERIDLRKEEFDIVVIIRGGGAEKDLKDLETYELARKVAIFPLPILTGIGHHKDKNVLDMVSFRPFKTPTAVADFLIEQRRLQLDQLLNLQAQLEAAYKKYREFLQKKLATGTLRLQQRLLMRLSRNRETLLNRELGLRSGVKVLLQRYFDNLHRQTKDLPLVLHRHLGNQRENLTNIAKLLTVLHPKRTLQRGFAIVRYGRRFITSAKDLLPGESVDLYFAEGEAKVLVEDVKEKTSLFDN